MSAPLEAISAGHSLERLRRAFRTASDRLLAERNPQGYWTGNLSVSPLANAVACVALHLVDAKKHAAVVDAGLRFLVKSQNPDGGFGDTLKSKSNIATTMLARAAFARCKEFSDDSTVVAATEKWIADAGGIPALRRRYGKDQTFSAPILTCCALSGVVDWKEAPRLPFELACIPARFYSAVKLPVVSYALPALIAIGQVREHFGASPNPLLRFVRRRARIRSLAVLESIQPTSGGFLEATPLTAFVTMSLAGMGLVHHPVVRRGVEFLLASQRADGGWPIDTNLATWVTTLSVNALGDALPTEARPRIREWLLGQQYKEAHPYTQAQPWGWAWTDLPGGVPDADDTSGAVLALEKLSAVNDEERASVSNAQYLGVFWLRELQNRDGGVPTFCKGWGTLPFDRSSCDITAHALRASNALPRERQAFVRSLPKSRQRALDYLQKQQRPDGSWTPLWFGNQDLGDEENPTYGTSRVLLALAEFEGDQTAKMARQGMDWFHASQNADGGWGAGSGTFSSVEETALALEGLASLYRRRPEICPPKLPAALWRGAAWLVEKVESGEFANPSPIGFYFAKLWYFEALYPIIWTAAALRLLTEALADRTDAVENSRNDE